MSIWTIVVFLVQSLTVLGALFVLGYPFQQLARRLTRRDSTLVLTPLWGIYPLAQVSWTWSEVSDSGLHLVQPLTVALFACLSALIGWRKWRRCSRSAFMRSTKAAVAIPAGLFVVAAAMWVIVYHPYFALHYVTPVTLGNYDIAAFAIGAEHLRIHGFADAGNIAGIRLGMVIRSDTFATFALDLLPATLLRRAVWLTSESTLFTGWVLIVAQLYVLIQRGFRKPKVAAALASLTAIATPLMWFVVGHGYMSQMFGTALFFGGLTVVLAMRLDRRGVVAASVQLGIISAALWLLYPFVAIVMPVLAFAIRLGAVSMRRMFRFVALAAITAVAQWVISAVLALSRFPVGFDQAVGQGNAIAGWPLPAFYPQEILGFTSSFAKFSPDHRWIGSVPIIAFLLVGTAMLWKRVTDRLVLMALAVGFGSYVAIYIRSGVSYQQWKWAAFMTPLLVASFALMLTGIVQWMARYAKATDIRRLRLASVALVVPVLISTYAWNTYRMTDKSFSLDQKTSYVQPQLATAAGNETVESLPQLGLRINAWDEMWITSFFPKTTMYHFAFYNYYPVVRVRDVWMLERKDDATSVQRTVAEQNVDDLYRLVKRAPAGKAEVKVLDWSHETSLYATGNWKVAVKNTGTTTWVSPQDDPQHGFSLVTSLIGTQFQPGDRFGVESSRAVRPKDAEAPQFVINDKFDVAELPKGVKVAPGQTHVFEGTFVNHRPGDFALQFDPSTADVGQFEMWGPETVAAIDVK